MILDVAAWPHRVHSAEAVAVQHHLEDTPLTPIARTASRYSKVSPLGHQTSTCASKQDLRVAFPTELLRGLHKKTSWNEQGE